MGTVGHPKVQTAKTAKNQMLQYPGFVMLSAFLLVIRIRDQTGRSQVLIPYSGDEHIVAPGA